MITQIASVEANVGTTGDVPKVPTNMIRDKHFHPKPE